MGGEPGAAGKSQRTRSQVPTVHSGGGAHVASAPLYVTSQPSCMSQISFVNYKGLNPCLGSDFWNVGIMEILNKTNLLPLYVALSGHWCSIDY